MRILIISLFLLASNLYYWGIFESFDGLRLGVLAAKPLAVKDGLISIAGILLLLEALLVIRRGSNFTDELKARAEQEAQQAKRSEEEREKFHRVQAAEREEAQRVQAAEREAAQRVQAAQQLELKQLKIALEAAERKAIEAEKNSAPQARREDVDKELLNLLSLFQEKGRLVDFLMDDVSPYSDEQVGAAARVVHQGCATVLNEFFKIQPAHQGQEGETLTLEGCFSPKRYRLIGSAGGESPITGTVLHRGWRASEVSMPRSSTSESAVEDRDIIAPTELQV
jgi:hypothetical protein